VDVYRQSVSAEPTSSTQCKTTLDEYDEFSKEMSTVSDEWQECKRLIEAYNEQQVSRA